MAIISVEEKENKKKKGQGSAELQIFHFTNKINKLALHLKSHKKDFSSEISIRKMLRKRQRLVTYLAKKNRIPYKK